VTEIDVPQNVRVFSVANLSGQRLVVARNDAVVVYKDGVFQKRFDNVRDTAKIKKVAASTYADMFYVWAPNYSRDRPRAAQFHVERVKLRGEFLWNDYNLNFADWDTLSDFAVGDDERFYVVGKHSEAGPAVAVYDAREYPTELIRMQPLRADQGELLRGPTHVAVDRDNDNVFVIDETPRGDDIILVYNKDLGVTHVGAVTVPDQVYDLVADHGVLAASLDIGVQVAPSAREPRPPAPEVGGFVLYTYVSGRTGPAQSFRQPGFEHPSAGVMNMPLAGYNTSDTCGKLWGAVAYGGEQDLVRYDVCSD
jgi:hypothetical protein